MLLLKNHIVREVDPFPIKHNGPIGSGEADKHIPP